jgi:hypothetical protein
MAHKKKILSDPPDVPLYILEEKRDADGLKLYACCRGTNHVRNVNYDRKKAITTAGV